MKIYSDGTMLSSFPDPFDDPEKIKAFLEEPAVEYIEYPFFGAVLDEEATEAASERLFSGEPMTDSDLDILEEGGE